MPGAPFTAETGARAGAAGRAAQAKTRLERAERLAKAANGQDFLDDTLARVRMTITDTLQRLQDSKDAKDRELYARALSHLAETERKLAGRPLPGSRRPGAAAPPAPPSSLPEPS